MTLTQAISEVLIAAIDSQETGRTTLKQTLDFIDMLAEIVPRDSRQQQFYAAMGELARKVDAQIR